MSLAQAVQEGRRFWASAAGQALWQAERACLGPVCEALFGQHSLQLGMAPRLTDMCPIRHALAWAPTRDLAEDSSSLVCMPDSLPLPDDSLDLVVIHHLLETVPEAHHVIREATRVIHDDGRLVILGWHPFGIEGLSRMWPARRRQNPWRGQWRSSARLRDWLTFVDFEIERVDYCGFRMPGGATRNQHLETLGRRYNLPLGGTYLIVARRKTIRVQPIRPEFSSRPLLAGSWLGHSPLHSCERPSAPRPYQQHRTIHKHRILEVD
ncbi:methyltransferase domain-containing protein [Halomonas sp. WWR20]